MREDSRSFRPCSLPLWIDVVAAGARTGVARNHFYNAAPASGVGIAVPSSMKGFPIEVVPQ
jgi:hypothetical protein